MEGKKINESAVLTAQLMSPQDANAAGNIHGGAIMKLIDDAAGAVSELIYGLNARNNTKRAESTIL